MRVGLLIYGSLETVSGGYLYDRRLVNHLQQQRMDVVIISLPWSCYGRHLMHNFSPSLLTRLRRLEVDILLQDELNHPSLFALNGWLKRSVSYPLISIVHHLRIQEQWPSWQRPFYKQIERLYLASVDGFIFNSQTTRQTVTDLLGSERPYVVATPAGNRFRITFTHDDIVRRAHQPGPLRLLFVGNVIPRKGLHQLVAALAQIADANWRLDAVGDSAISPTYTQHLQQQIAAARLTKKITLHGRCSDDALQAWYAQSHVLVVPSQVEGFGIVYLEGMAFGLPAVASTSGAAHELIVPGENGYLVAVGNTAVLAQHIHTLIHNRVTLAHLSKAALRRYREHPTWEKSMQKASAFLQRFCSIS